MLITTLARATAVCALLILFAAHTASAAPAEAKSPPPLKVEIFAAGLNLPWSMAFAPDGTILIIEKAGGLRVYREGALLPATLPESRIGLPDDVMVKEDSGLHDIALDPDFATTQTVFIAYAGGDEKANHTSVWRARLAGNHLADGQTIFRVAPDKAGAHHPGGRILFLPDKTFLLTVGDGFDDRDAAQDLSSDLGKILRLDRGGKPPADNPCIGRADVRPEIYTYGHRNAQGLTIDTETGVVWEHEHGPRGGDEINRLTAGSNYGWPLTTNGVGYDGYLISERAHAPGITSPLIVWAPSIAPSGLAVYRGSEFPDWNGNVLVGALKAKLLVRAQLDNEERSIGEVERLLADLGARIRDVRVGPDGLVYILTDEANGRLIRPCRDC
ncbi:MAG: PQQ-dependent sugar dehydrogenase [Xanthomonadales bacterium]|nr:PQQ-dependent sugar dehydrogenase [Xanthomonadales bacterium]